MLTATLVSFAVIFVAELGDKSQLMALAFATRFPALTVLHVVPVPICTGAVRIPVVPSPS